MLDLSLIIPAYNEEKRLSQTLLEYLNFFTTVGLNFEIIVVVNGSTDQTYSVAKELSTIWNNLRVLEYLDKIGKGQAVLNGLRQASPSNYLGFVDADLATTPKEYCRLFKLAENFDGVIASRLLPGSQVYGRKFMRQCASRCFSYLRRLLVPLPFLDSQCGAKVFSGVALGKVLPKLTVTDMTLDVELLKALYQNRYFIREEPSLWVDQTSTTFTTFNKLFGISFRMFENLLKIRKNNYYVK